MMPVPPIIATWTDEGVFRPSPRMARICDKHFAVGEVYEIEVGHGRSIATHNHQFAWLKEAWLTLPEEYSNEPWAQSPEHLRKHALIRTGFCHVEQFACGSNAEALRWAPRLRADDEYCVVAVEGTIVTRYRAMSQSQRAMGGKRFQESKQAVIDFVAGLLGVSPETLQEAA